MLRENDMDEFLKWKQWNKNKSKQSQQGQWQALDQKHVANRAEGHHHQGRLLCHFKKSPHPSSSPCHGFNAMFVLHGIPISWHNRNFEGEIPWGLCYSDGLHLGKEVPLAVLAFQGGQVSQTVAAKCLGQAVGADKLSLPIHTKCATTVISLLIISCGLRGAHKRQPHLTSCSCLFCGAAVASKAGPFLGAEEPGN